jgi:hypothetical protein
MAKIVLSTFLKEVHGKLDNVVFRKIRGKYVMSPMPPGREGFELSQAQSAHQERFLQAAEYGSLALADPAAREFYEQKAVERDLPVMAACIADFFNPPSIVSIDASNYNGQPGGTIEIKTRDDYGVVRTSLVLADDDEGTLIEQGEAVEVAAGKGLWMYTATTAANAGVTVNFQVTLRDRPGGTAVQRGTKRI